MFPLRLKKSCIFNCVCMFSYCITPRKALKGMAQENGKKCFSYFKHSLNPLSQPILPTHTSSLENGKVIWFVFLSHGMAVFTLTLGMGP